MAQTCIFYKKNSNFFDFILKKLYFRIVLYFYLFVQIRLNYQNRKKIYMQKKLFKIKQMLL